MLLFVSVIDVTPTLPTATFGVTTLEMSLAAGASWSAVGTVVSMLFFGKYVATEPGREVGTLVSAW